MGAPAAGCGVDDAAPPGGDRDRGQEVVPGDDGCEDGSLRPDEDNLDRVRTATLCLVNGQRLEHDLDPLRADDALTDAAGEKAADMVQKRYFAHVGPDDRNVRDWAGDAGYLDGARGTRLGENLGWASAGGATPTRLVGGWMDSRGHRENILREDWQDSGIGVALGAPREEGGGGATYVQMFGRR